MLGVRNHHFFDQPDRRFTLEMESALEQQWDVGLLRRSLRALMEREQYDFIFALLPCSSTHGHHQAATLLAAEVIAALPAGQRPVLLAADAGPAGERPAFASPGDRALFRAASPEPVLEFDRRRGFGYENALNYTMVVHWLVAEHKSQGLFQSGWGKDDIERFWHLDATAPADAAARIARLRADLEGPHQEPARPASERAVTSR